MSRPTTIRCSSSPTTRDDRSRWPAGRRSTSSPTGSTPRSRQATDAAGGLDVRLGGGVSTVRQYLDAGLIDELQFDVVPVLLGSGERLFGDLSTLTEGYACTEFVGTADALHVTCSRYQRA